MLCRLCVTTSPTAPSLSCLWPPCRGYKGIVDYTLAVQMPQYMQLREYLMRCGHVLLWPCTDARLTIPHRYLPLVCYIASCVSACDMSQVRHRRGHGDDDGQSGQVISHRGAASIPAGVFVI